MSAWRPRPGLVIAIGRPRGHLTNHTHFHSKTLFQSRAIIQGNITWNGGCCETGVIWVFNSDISSSIFRIKWLWSFQKRVLNLFIPIRRPFGFALTHSPTNSPLNHPAHPSREKHHPTHLNSPCDLAAITHKAASP